MRRRTRSSSPFGRRKRCTTCSFRTVSRRLSTVHTSYRGTRRRSQPRLVDAAGAPIDGVQQTVDILANGRLGVFHEIDAAGNPLSLVPDRRVRSSPRCTPAWGGWLRSSVCFKEQPTNVNGKRQTAFATAVHVLDGALSGPNYGGLPPCPQKRAVREGYEGQLMGFQTSNDVATPDELSGPDGTLNSNITSSSKHYEHTLSASTRQGNAPGRAQSFSTSAGRLCRRTFQAEEPGSRGAPPCTSGGGP